MRFGVEALEEVEGDTPRRLPRSRKSRPTRETPSLVTESLNSSRGNLCKVGGSIHTNSTRVVFLISIKLLMKAEELPNS